MTSQIQVYDIQEPEEEQNPLIAHNAIGIDLGTTYSLVSVVKDGDVVAIPSDNGNLKLPSAVKFLDDSVSIGEELNASSTIISVKKWMGKNNFSVDTNQGAKNASEISAEILKSLKVRAEKFLGQPIEHAVITVPAYFNDNARNATKLAAQLAGLNVLRLINEPTAAAYAYGFEKKSLGNVAVYDLGGGTFDISILRIQNGIFKVLSTVGDVNLGGDRLDEKIKLTLLEELNIEPQNTDEDRYVLLKAREIKEHLSSNIKWEGDIAINSEVHKYSFTIGKLEKIIDREVQYSIDLMEKAIADAGLKVADLDALILVGGSTKIPYIKHSIEQRLNVKVLNDTNPDLIVAKGAGLQASALTVGTDNLLLDITPFTLGIELMGNATEPVIHKNTPIPVEFSKTFTTSVNNQKNISIRVMQGLEDGNEYQKIATFELNNIPLMKAGQPVINVTFRVDADGILTVSAVEENSKVANNIMVNIKN